MKTLDKKDVSMDWEKFGSIELKRLSEEIRTNNPVLNELGAYIAFCDIEQQIDTKQIDQNFVKLFRCSQVLIEFLLTEFNRFKTSENERKTQNHLIRENKKLRKLLEIQQKAMTYSRTFNGDNVQCPHCPKVFFDPIFLKTHITRRHPNETLDSEGMMCLTDKIKDYQKVLIGDNQSLDKLKEEIKELTQKLVKTETDLITEKDERIKLEERIEYVMKVRDKEIQQTLKEELEEFKFIQRERDIEKAVQKYEPIGDIDVIKSGINTKDLEIHKIEEIIAIQAKEMIKLGNNVQKLVTHLTDSEEVFGVKTKTKAFVKTLNQIKTNENAFNESQELEKEEKIQPKATNERSIHSNKNHSFDKIPKELSPEKTKTRDLKKSECIGTTDAFNEVERSLNDKLVSLKIDINSVGITKEQYSFALKKLMEEKTLLIHQNRYDYDFNSVEQQIRKFVDKKVRERTGQSIKDTTNSTFPLVEESKSYVNNEVKTQTQKGSQQSVEAIVHSMPINEQVLDSIQDISEEIETKTDSNHNSNEKEVIQELSSTVSPKSVLKSIIVDRNAVINQNKAKDRRIRFSEHRIEHQLSPDESSEDTSEEYGPVVSDARTHLSNQPNITLGAPIPAQRTRKTDPTLDSETNQLNEDLDEDNNYEIDDQLMNEILHTNTFISDDDSTSVKSFSGHNSSQQTKVQELAEMIEQQLNKRSTAHKKPPIGSVDVMTERKVNANQSSVRRIDSDSEESD